MLSDCRGCKYFHLDGCAVNPGYWQVERLVRPNLTPEELNAAEMMLLPCPHWQHSEMPHPDPIDAEALEFCYSPPQPQDVYERYLAVRELLGRRPVRRKSWQERLFDAIEQAAWTFLSPLVVFFNSIIGKILFMLGMVLLTVSDPQFPGALPDLPPILQGYEYAQGLCLFVVVYQTSNWALAIKRGEFPSTRHMFNDIKFTLLLLLLQLGLAAWGGKPA